MSEKIYLTVIRRSVLTTDKIDFNILSIIIEMCPIFQQEHNSSSTFVMYLLT